MADQLTYGQEQAEKNLSYWQGMSGRMRRPSPLASPEERAAFAAQEVRGGRAPIYRLPEDYGGMPMGTTRRAIRAREQWAQQQEQITAYNQEMAARQKAEMDARVAELDYANKALKFQTDQYDLLRKQESDALEGRVKSENALNALRFQTYANQFDPNDPSSYGKLNDTLAKNPALAANEDIQKTMYYFKQAADNSVAGLTNTALSEAAQLGIPQEQIQAPVENGGALRLDPSGAEVIDIRALRGIIDRTKGERTLAEEARKDRPTLEERAKITEQAAEARSARSLVKGFEQKSTEVDATIARLQKLVEKNPKDKTSQVELEAKLAEKAIYDARIQELLQSYNEQPTSAQTQTTGQKRTARDIFGD